MYAIKGTNEDMQCRGYQYAISKTYKMDDNPILCECGFHACLNPYDVLYHYANNGKNRYFLVELGGTITDCDMHDSKVATNEITFIKEVFVNDFPALYEEFRKDKERLAKLFYEEGFVEIHRDWKYNFINKNGRYISKKWFDFVESFSGGFAVVNKNGKYNFICHDGKLISKKWFDEAWWFSEGFAKVRKYDKWNFIDKEGKLLCEEWFDNAGSFSEGVAEVMKDKKYYRLYPDGHLEVS